MNRERNILLSELGCGVTKQKHKNWDTCLRNTFEERFLADGWMYLTRRKPMLIEILYGSQGSFTLEFGQTPNPRAARPHWASPSAEQLLKLSSMAFAFFLHSPSSSWLSNLLCPSPLSFPATGSSHNCRLKWPSTAGGNRDRLGRVWMLSSGGTLSTASKQRMLLPTSKSRQHKRQTGGHEAEYSNHRGCVFEVGR